jgi:hypothetical protein
VLLQSGAAADKERIGRNRHYLEVVGRIDTVTWLEPGDDAPESATALVGEMKLLIPLSGLIDKEAEMNRLTKELERKTGELERCEKKLSNASFVDKAPAAVVDKEQAKALNLKSNSRKYSHSSPGAANFITSFTTPQIVSINTTVTSKPTRIYCDGFPCEKSCSRFRLLCTPNILASTLPSTPRNEGDCMFFVSSESVIFISCWRGPVFYRQANRLQMCLFKYGYLLQ